MSEKHYIKEAIQLLNNVSKHLPKAELYKINIIENTLRSLLNQQTTPQLSDDVEEYISIIQDSCAECKYSCWYKEDYDLDACELNKEMYEIDLNASMIGDGCPLPNLIKQHIQAQANTIDRTQYQLEIAWEQITDYENQLNAIREVLEQMEHTEYTDAEQIYDEYHKIKQILGDE